QKHFKGAMPIHTDRPAAGVAQQLLHLRAPLGVCRAAQREAEAEQPGPVFAGPVVLVGEAFAKQVLPGVHAVIVIAVAEEPRRQGFLFLGLRLHAYYPAISRRLGCEETLESRTGQLAGIPLMIRTNLGIADIGL